MIASTSEAFRAFEARYGDKLPRVRGDWTPYWEDGAGSSALETGLNRASADRLAQAETLWAMLDPEELPRRSVRGGLAQRPALLRAHLGGVLQRSPSRPAPLTQDQWKIKQSYAAQANLQSRELLVRALANRDERRRSDGRQPRTSTSTTPRRGRGPTW